MSLADSIRQTASIARWVSAAVTAPDHTTFTPGGKVVPRARPASVTARRSPPIAGRAPALLPSLVGEAAAAVPVLEHLADLAHTLAHYPEEALGQLDRLLLRLHLDDGKAGDQLLRLGEGSVGHGEFPSVDLDTGALRAGQ